MFKFVVLCAVLALASAKPYYPYVSPMVSAYSAYPMFGYSGYPGAVIGANGVPLDTPEVAAAKSLHFTAKALATHGIAKRDVYTPIAYSAYSTPYVASYTKPLAYSSAYTYPATGYVAPAPAVVF